ncbi:MAG: hypothetical protein M1816_004066 [Peltula sp. TS41687]|nr:MAG: hypothetical protein M1816_004066 [Peltula sp. TS41687]
MSRFNIQSSTDESRENYPVFRRAQSPTQNQGSPSFQIFAPPITSHQPRNEDYARLQTRDGRQLHPNAAQRLSGALSDPSVSEPMSAPAYHIPQPSAPPMLPSREASGINRHQTTSRNPSMSSASKKHAHRSGSLLHAGRKMASRWNSTRSTGRDKRFSLISNSGRYDVLEETEESDLSYTGARAPSRRKGGLGYKNVRSMEEDGPGEDFGLDLSSLDGSIALKRMHDTNSFHAAVDTDQEQAQGTLAAEYYQLEADGTFTDGLGGGMVAACLPVDASKNAPASTGADIRRTSKYFGEGLSRGMTIRDVGRMEAKKRNQMVVINEASPAVDISSLGSNDRNDVPITKSNNNSYYFPPDPEMPNWKPFSMRWPYITTLILLSLIMAGIQEYLNQESARRKHRGDGLLKFKKVKDLTTWQFFCWKYLPTIIFVTHGVLWQIVDFEVKRLEPYYQLSRPEGALADESLNRDYLTCWPILAPFKALRYRQWAVVYSSIVYLIASPLVPVLQSASIMVTPDQKDRRSDQFKYVHMHPVWSRLLTAALILVSINGSLVLLQLRRKSGLLSDPKGIAGVGAMANKSFILMDFKNLDTAREEEIHHRLKHRRYNLHKSSLWQGEYIRLDEEDVELKKPKNPHPLMLRLVAGIPYIMFMLLFMGFIPLLMFFRPVNNVGQHVPWLLTALASVVKVIWGTLEGDVRMMEPFYILSRRKAKSDTLTLDYTGTVPGWLPIRALISRHYLVALVGLAAIMTEILTVTVSSLSVRGDIFFQKRGASGTESENRSNSEETFKSVWVSLAISQGILTWLCFSACLVYLRRRHPFLPREPGTIASVMAFIHQSKMLVDFVGTERLTSREMARHLREQGKTYGLGWFMGRDGQVHCGIDEEPLKDNYVHGSNLRQATNPWDRAWDRYD